MKIADLARLRLPADPTVSPDGKEVVVSVTRVDLDADEYRSDLWLLSTDGAAAPRQLTNGPRDTAPLFSPDGRWLAFVRAEKDGKPQLHVLPVAGGEPTKLTDHPLGVDAPAWCPQSQRLAYVARVPEQGRYGTDPDVPPEKEPPRRITSRKYRVDNLGFTRDRRPHIFVVEVDGGEPRQLTHGDWDDAAPAWSPDGSTIAFASARHATRESDVITDIHLVPAAGGEPRTLTDSTLPASQPAFVDDRTVVFLSDSHPDIVGRDMQLFRVSTDRGESPTALTDPESWHLDGYGTGSRQPLIVDGRSVLTQNQRRGALELVRVPVDGGDPVVEVGGRRQVLGAACNGGVTVIVVASDTSTAEVAVVAEDRSERVLSDFGADIRDNAGLLPMHEIETPAPDGYPVHGWIVKPDGAGPFPVILAIHGGPFTQYGWIPFDEAQVYASAGYAVVLGNPRGSSGYGEAHGRSIVGDMGNLDRIDLLTLLDRALEEPELDADRVGVMGGSYGGFMTTWLAGTESRFQAAISERSVNAWDSFVGSSDIGWFFVDNYCGTDPVRQREQSPLQYADGIRAPMLIIHSEEDWRCPVEQAQRLFERLQRNGVESEMLLFPGEGHELSRSGLPSHRVARFEAILDWWSRHMPAQSDDAGSGSRGGAAGAT